MTPTGSRDDRAAARQPSLFDPPAPHAQGEPPASRPPDQDARDAAVDPRQDVVLEASAGTGKTRVLVDRYVRLIQEGVDPRHILAMTFTRKAAAEMRDRALAELRRRADRGELAPDIWSGLRTRIADIQISTIDAFCFGLLREFPLEADVDPAFEIADETEMARFANEALDLTLRAARGLVEEDAPVRLLCARVKAPVLRDALGGLLDRRHVALPAVAGFVRARTRPSSPAEAAAAFVQRLREVIDSSPHRASILDDGPRRSAEFEWLRGDLLRLGDMERDDPARVSSLRRRLERHFLRADLQPRQRLARSMGVTLFPSADARRRHEQGVAAVSPGVFSAIQALDADLNSLLARGLLRLLAIAVRTYERLLDEHAVLDFAGMLGRAVALLTRQEEFARSRLKLQSRYHHLLIDEFQDTSRLQWRLVELLIQAWGEGEGAADAPTSVFIVGDRKQSIYRFRHAEATLLDEAAKRISALRPGRRVRRAISHSYRAVPELLAFINAVAAGMQSGSDLEDRFRYEPEDQFPVPSVEPGGRRDGAPVVGLIAQATMAAAARAVALEIERLLQTAVVRARDGAPRAARPDDIAILFRARTGHQFFEEALAARGIRTYVYKGLGFFDAPEVQDLQAMLRYVARPESNLRAAEFLRSRLVRVSDRALVALAPHFAAALRSPGVDLGALELDPIDRALLEQARASLAVWLPLADRLPPGELVDRLLADAAYAFELRGRRLDQARENLKKVRGLIRRVEARGYATLGRLADYFETLKAGEESNAVVAASGCVNLMTIHAAKGLEFPIVFVVNLHIPGRGRPGGFSVIDRGPDGEPDVAFSPTDATRFEDLREAEELRRLLYVAMTRARDRLYLSAEVDGQGRLRRGSRSLAGCLPGALAAAFATAATGAVDVVAWETPGGRFDLAACRPPELKDNEPVQAATAGPAPSLLIDDGMVDRSHSVASPVAGGLDREGRSTVTAPRRIASDHPARPDAPDLAGTLVHRLLRRRPPATVDDAGLTTLALSLARSDELVDVGDRAAMLARTVARYRSLREHPDVSALLASGEVHHEVPVSFYRSERPTEVVRGVIDCLVRSPDGAVTVIEFKTGVPRAEHEAQAAAYASALGAIWPDRRISVQILYA